MNNMKQLSNIIRREHERLVKMDIKLIESDVKLICSDAMASFVILGSFSF